MMNTQMELQGIVDPVFGVAPYEALMSNTDMVSHESFSIPEETIFGIPAHNHIRRDSNQVIYYGRTLFDIWVFRLLPEQVFCLSLFDGKRTIKDIAENISFLSDCNYEAASLKIRYFLKSLEFPKKGTFVDVKKRPATKIYPINFDDYFIKDTVRTFRLDAPTSLILMPTDQCLTDCEYCYACRQPVPDENLLSVKRILELVDEAHEIGVISMNVDGGDIFARKEHMEILERILEYNIDPSISTKGYVSKEKAKELAQIGLKWLQVGLDSTREMCDKLVRRSGYFDRIVETIYNLTEAGIRVRTNSIITCESLHLLPELVDFLMTLPLFDIKVAPAFLGLYRSNESMLLTKLQKQWYRKVMDEKVKQYPDHKINHECEEDILDAGESEIENWFKSRPYCSSGRTQIVIAPDGKVVTCEQSPQEGEFVCGDVTRQSIMEVWNSEALKEWYEPPLEKFKETACYDCSEFQSCIHGMGHCWLQVLKMQGRLYAPHPYCPKSEKPKQRWR
jgi:radical SAM protein with 4Fe4S-binding SPASM domain